MQVMTDLCKTQVAIFSHVQHLNLSHAEEVVVFREDEWHHSADDSSQEQRHQIASQHGVVLKCGVVCNGSIFDLQTVHCSGRASSNAWNMQGCMYSVKLNCLVLAFTKEAPHCIQQTVEGANQHSVAERCPSVACTSNFFVVFLIVLVWSSRQQELVATDTNQAQNCQCPFAWAWLASVASHRFCLLLDMKTTKNTVGGFLQLPSPLATYLHNLDQATKPDS